ncbi:signal peptidase II [Sphingomonas tabacisoli]|uniref:Lipoprotein signal peptidase n=1 Tax=Sphingomonas tabacisoli TaxID=2249466 RepID=A0ABW4I0L3_9SPHN
MNAPRRLGLSIALGVFLLDQLVKWVVMGPLKLGEVGAIELLTFFRLYFVQNFGVSMGFLTAGSDMTRWALVALTAAIGTGVLVWLWRETNRGDIAALGLVLGGAAGNILDRVRFGYVVDFLDLHFGDFRPFLVFNVADAAITIGVLILLLRALFARPKAEPAENVNA